MDKIESNFELLGATAIEDKLQVEKAGGRREGGREGVGIALEGGFLIQFPGTLQEGVPETIHDLTRAGIKVNILSILVSAMTGAYNVFHSQECASWLVEDTSTQGPKRAPEPSRRHLPPSLVLLSLGGGVFIVTVSPAHVPPLLVAPWSWMFPFLSGSLLIGKFSLAVSPPRQDFSPSSFWFPSMKRNLAAFLWRIPNLDLVCFPHRPPACFPPVPPPSQVWMLTGDKEETAVNIGVACNLLEHSTKVTISQPCSCLV